MPVLIQTDIKPIRMPLTHNMMHILHVWVFIDQRTLDVALYCKVERDDNPLERHFELMRVTKG